MLFTIIIPVYNVEKYIDECILSVLNQTFKDYEVILVDDGSTDKSPLICDKYCSYYENFSVIHKENGGLSSTWVAALELINGEYTLSIDSDDYIEDDLLEKLSEVIFQTNVDIIVYGYKGVNNEGIIGLNKIRAKPGIYKKEQIRTSILPGLINIGNISNRSNIYLSRINKTIKTTMLKKNKEYYRSDVSYGEDNMWTIPNIISANSLYVFRDYYPYCYRYNERSITHIYNDNLWEKFCILDNHLLNVINKLNCKDLNNQIYRDCVFHSVMAINNVLLSNQKRKNKIKQIKHIINNKHVRQGVNEMVLDTCTFIEKINIYLIILNNEYFIYYYKSMKKYLQFVKRGK